MAQCPSIFPDAKNADGSPIQCRLTDAEPHDMHSAKSDGWEYDWVERQTGGERG